MKYNPAASDSHNSDATAGMVMFETPDETRQRLQYEADDRALANRGLVSLKIFASDRTTTVMASGNYFTLLKSAVFSTLEGILLDRDFDADYESYAIWTDAILTPAEQFALVDGLLHRGFASVELVDEMPVRDWPLSA